MDLEEQETPVIFRDVNEGRADVGVAPYFTSHEGLQTFPYRSYDLCLVVPAGHVLAARRTGPIRNLHRGPGSAGAAGRSQDFRGAPQAVAGAVVPATLPA
ncbi:MAG: LysR substrate-binding domain-containing protein [Lautropia sp.]